jgi:hypothetical protein
VRREAMGRDGDARVPKTTLERFVFLRFCSSSYKLFLFFLPIHLFSPLFVIPFLPYSDLLPFLIPEPNRLCSAMLNFF